MTSEFLALLISILAQTYQVDEAYNDKAVLCKCKVEAYPVLCYLIIIDGVLLIILCPLLIHKYFVLNPLDIGYIGNEHASILSSILPD